MQTLTKYDGKVNIDFKKLKFLKYFKYEYKLLKLKLP